MIIVVTYQIGVIVCNTLPSTFFNQLPLPFNFTLLELLNPQFILDSIVPVEKTMTPRPWQQAWM